MFVSNILTDLCATRQKMRVKNILIGITYNVLVVKKSCKKIKSLFENKW